MYNCHHVKDLRGEHKGWFSTSLELKTRQAFYFCSISLGITAVKWRWRLKQGPVKVRRCKPKQGWIPACAGMTRRRPGTVTPAQAGVHAVQTLQCDFDRALALQVWLLQSRWQPDFRLMGEGLLTELRTASVGDLR